MLLTKVLIFLFVWVTITHSTSYMNRLIFDLTKPLNDLTAKESSEEDFNTRICSAFNATGSDFMNVTIFYETAGKTVQEMEQETLRVAKLINDTINIRDALLIISWTVTPEILDEVGFGKLYKKSFWEYELAMVMNFHENITCDELAKFDFLFWNIFVSSSKSVGIGYKEFLIGCEYLNIFFPEFILINWKFGNTVGVTESYGLFQTRLKFLSEAMLEELGGFRKNVIYFPNAENVGDNKHQRLLMNYAKTWTSSQTKKSLVLQVPEIILDDLSEKEEFSIIPTITQHPNEMFPEWFSWSSVLFGTGFKSRQSLMMSSRQWWTWKEKTKKLYDPNVSVAAKQFDIIVEYDTDPRKFSTDSLTDTIASSIKDNEGNLGTAIVFHLTCGNPPHNSKFCRPRNEFGKSMSQNLKVGCLLHLKSFEAFKTFNATSVVETCQEINGSIYILKPVLVVRWFSDSQSYSFHYENVIRKTLHAVKILREEILGITPQASVYLQPELEEKYRPISHNSMDFTYTLFCDELESETTMYLEAIVNWAHLENFRIIAGTYFRKSETNFGFQQGFQLYSGWFSLLRRLNCPYLEGLTGNVTAGSHPCYLVQNYLKANFNWKLDTCLQTKEEELDVKFDYFYNTAVGTSFHQTEYDEDVYVIMFQFVFHRFHLAELEISTDFESPINAIDFVLTQRSDSNTTIFIHFVENSYKSLDNLKSFLSFLESSMLFETTLLKGIHVEFSETATKERAHNMLNIIKNSGLGRGITSNCEKILQSLVLDPSIAELLTHADYIVCTDKISLPLSSKRSEWKPVLDFHLFIKRVLHSLTPHLKLYFRVELPLNIEQSSEQESKGYISLFSIFKLFSADYDINYFIVNAFDDPSVNIKSGWWEIQNFTDLTNPKSYVEKLTVYNGHTMWYPPAPDPINVTTTVSLPPIKDSPVVAIVSSVSAVILLILLALAVLIGLRWRKLRFFLSDAEIKAFMNGRPSTSIEMGIMGAESAAEFMVFDAEYELPMSELSVDTDNVIGSGNFGTVYKGKAKGVPAAIKKPNENCDKTIFKSVLNEIKVHCYIGKHDNIVTFLGAYTKEIRSGFLYIATELCSIGSLEALLRSKKIVVSVQESAGSETDLQNDALYFYDLHRFAKEIANGMEFIQSKQVVHGDLSTRNVMLDENYTCKIGDFGLSRKLYEYKKYVKKSQDPLPWKWMAYETLTKMEFTSKSDVWSFGVTLWEIYSLGNTPYGGLNWNTGFVEELENGLRLGVPRYATETTIFPKMEECWNLEPNQRPNFNNLANFFRNLCNTQYAVV